MVQGIAEEAPAKPENRESYIPYKKVAREAATSTKLRVVYDASAKATPDSPSLNDCLYPGPSLQNKLWKVLVLQRTHPVALVGDVKQDFLQIHIKETERDALRFHWRQRNDEIQILRFTIAQFGLAPSPFLLGGVLEAHLDMWKEKLPNDVEEIRRSFHVDDILSGGETVQQAQERKQAAVTILDDTRFSLHKWASNESDLEDEPNC
jgi:hypothetical protein